MVPLLTEIAWKPKEDVTRIWSLCFLHAEATVDSLESVKEDLNLKGGSSTGEEAAEGSPRDGFKGFVEFIKVKFEEMANRLSGFVKDFMGPAGAGNSSPATATATKTAGGGADAAAAAFDLSIGASFLALAVATILTILFKRGWCDREGGGVVSLNVYTLYLYMMPGAVKFADYALRYRCILSYGILFSDKFETLHIDVSYVQIFVSGCTVLIRLVVQKLSLSLSLTSLLK